MPSGGEYSDPDPTKLLNACLSLKHEFPSEKRGCVTKPHAAGWACWKNESSCISSNGHSLNICPSNKLRLVKTLRRTEHFLHMGRLRKPYCKVPGHTGKYGSAANRAQLFSFWYCCHKYVSLFLWKLKIKFESVWVVIAQMWAEGAVLRAALAQHCAWAHTSFWAQTSTSRGSWFWS